MAEILPPVNPEAQAHADAAQAEADRLAAEQAERDGNTVQAIFQVPLGFAGRDFAASKGAQAVPLDLMSEAERGFYDFHVGQGNIVEVASDELAADGRPAAIARKPAAKRAKR